MRTPDSPPVRLGLVAGRQRDRELLEEHLALLRRAAIAAFEEHYDRNYVETRIDQALAQIRDGASVQRT